MKIFNQSKPKVIVTKDGVIHMFNDGFEKMIAEELKHKNIPSNLLKFIQSDTEALSKL